ncbi:MAG: F0F1 ATP synthase subunit A [Patescibacteria group bacterium]
MHIAPEVLFQIGIFNITNTLLFTLIVDAVILTASFFIVKNIQIVPRLFQNGVEMVIQTSYETVESIAGNKAAKIFPYFMSFFIFILLSNWLSLLPGIGTIGFFEENEGHRVLSPILRGSTSDINVTLGLALVSVAATHILSIKTLGIVEYLTRYFSINPINLFIGVLEIISEITKIISLSFRLFGNIFAGEVVLHTVSSLFAFVFPLPFLFLEMIVGFVQALVFAMLTMAFMAILTTSHSEAH